MTRIGRSAGDGMRVEVVRDNLGFGLLEKEWNTLLAASQVHAIFLTWQWQRAWWHHFGQENELYLLVLRATGGQLLGIAPLFAGPPGDPTSAGKGNPRLQFLGGADLSDYLDILCAASHEAEVYTTLWDHLLDRMARGEGVELRGLPSHSRSRHLLSNLAQEQGVTVAVQTEGTCPMIPLPPSWEEYLRCLSQKDRHELRRKMRRARLAGEMELEVVRKGENLATDLNDFFTFFKQAQGSKAEFLTSQVRAFFEEVFPDLAQHGWLALLFLRINGVRAAALLCFDYGEGLQLYNSAYDPRFAHLSVGTVAIAMAIQQAIHWGKVRFDFMRGNEPYKYHLGAKDALIYRLTMGQPMGGLPYESVDLAPGERQGKGN